MTVQEPGTAPVTLEEKNNELRNKVKIMEKYIVALEKRNIRTENCLEQALANKKLRDMMLDADKVHIGKLEELVLRYRHKQREDQAGGGVESIDDEISASSLQQEVQTLRDSSRDLQQKLEELKNVYSTDSDAKHAELDAVRMDALWWREKARYMQAKSWDYHQKINLETRKTGKEIEEETASISSFESGDPPTHRDKLEMYIMEFEDDYEWKHDLLSTMIQDHEQEQSQLDHLADPEGNDWFPINPSDSTQTQLQKHGFNATSQRDLKEQINEIESKLRYLKMRLEASD